MLQLGFRVAVLSGPRPIGEFASRNQPLPPILGHPTHPRPLPRGEQAFVRALSVPLLGGVRGGFMVPMRAKKRKGLSMNTSTPCRCAGVTRRSFLLDTGMGFTGLALSAILFRDGIARGESSVSGWQPPDGKPHFPPRAKSVIWIFLCGGVSHVESFDVKPELNQYAGKSIEETPYKEVLDPKRVNANIIGANPSHGNRKVIMPLQTGYKEYGKSGLVVGDWFKNIGEC